MQSIRCPHCNRPMTFADEAVGKRARCSKCKNVFRIEVPAQAEAVEVEQKTGEAAPPAEPVRQRREKPRKSADPPQRKKKKKPRVYVEVHYPAWLGILSCAWALVGWALASLAPHLAFVPLVGVLQYALPAVTVALIGANLYLAVRNLWRGAHPLALLLVTGLQMGLFTTLFFQLFAHLGAALYDVQGPTSTWQWLGFSLAHALRAWDVLDVIEAFSLNVQMIRHDGWLVAVFVILYHVVVDVFFLGVVWDVVERIKEHFLEDEGILDLVRKALKAAFALWFIAWMVIAFGVHRWAPIDIPLWFVENILRVVDFADIMESFDLSLHGLPREGLTGTLTFFCRLWIAIGIGLLLGRKKQAAERRVATPPGAGARDYWLARAGILAAGLLVMLGTGLLWQVVLVDPVPGLAAAAGGQSEGRATAALAALRRMGPTAQAAVPALTAARKTATEKTRDDITRTLGYLGTEAVDPLVDIALGEGEASAGLAVKSLGRIRPNVAPALAKVWSATPSEAVRTQAAAELQRFGNDAVPPLMAATTPENAEVHYHWFVELDRNWKLRSTPNKVAKALQKLPEMLQELKKDPDAATTVKILDGLKDCGSAARMALPAAIDRLGARDPKVQVAAAALLTSIGPSVTPELLQRLEMRAKLRNSHAGSLDDFRALQRLNATAAKLRPYLLNVLSNPRMWDEAALKDQKAIPALTELVSRRDTPGEMREMAVRALAAPIEMAIRDEMKSKSVVITSFNLKKQGDGGFTGTATAQNGDVFDITTSPDGGEWQAIPRYNEKEGGRAGEERDDNALKLKLCWCPTLTPMLRNPGHPGRFGVQGFWMGKYEVTQSEWAGLMGSLPSRALDKGKGDRHPVYYVTYDDATEFCRKLTDRERNAGRLPLASAYRLPTEAQWEYACRAGTTTATAFGDQLGSTQANFNGDWPYNGAQKGPSLGKTVAVGSYRPNAWGIYDMYGNVSEFTLTRGVIRGGSWSDTGGNCRSAIFIDGHPVTVPLNACEGSLGFRVARVPSEELLKGTNPKSTE